MPTLEVVDYSKLFCLFKGEPGTRKSGAALSFPKPIYFFDFDGKIEALGRPMMAWGINPKDVHYDFYKDWNSAEAKLQQFQTKCPYQTVVIDSITSCADAINRQTLKIKGSQSAGKSIAGIAVNSIEDFNAEDSALKELVAKLKDIKNYHKINVVLIAHVIQKESKSLDGKTHMSRTIVTAGKGIAQKIPAYCSEIYHFNIKMGIDITKGGQYSCLTVHTGDDMARSSLPIDAEIIFGNDPLYDKWILPAINKMVDYNKQNPISNTQPNSTQGK